MIQKLTDEQYEIVREAIKNKKAISFDAGDIINMSLRVESKPNRYLFENLDEDILDTVLDYRIRKYKVYLELIDSEQEEPLAQIAYMDIRMLPYDLSDIDIEIISDEDVDVNDTMISILRLDEMKIKGEHVDYWCEKYPSSQMNIAELHTCYVSPEFRGLGIVDYLYNHLNDLFYEEYYQVVYLLGVYVNPFKNQLSLSQIEGGEIPYINEIDENDELIKTMFKSLERNGFCSTKEDGRHFYKNMFDDKSFEYS